MKSERSPFILKKSEHSLFLSMVLSERMWKFFSLFFTASVAASAVNNDRTFISLKDRVIELAGILHEEQQLIPKERERERKKKTVTRTFNSRVELNGKNSESRSAKYVYFLFILSM